MEGGSWLSDELICVPRFSMLGAWKCVFFADRRNRALITSSVSKLKYLWVCALLFKLNAFLASGLSLMLWRLALGNLKVVC